MCDCMKIAEALLEWGYKNTRKNRDALMEICRRHPEMCKTLSPVNIKKRAGRIYIPDKRTKDTYVHIVRAVQNNAHLFPEVIGLTEEKVEAQLRQLSKAGIIEKADNKGSSATESYNTTLKTAMWLHKRKYQRVKAVIEIVEPLKPNSILSLPKYLSII